ncbi:MAG: amidohydrolase family protein [Nesterenkonia sp.]|nr:amidohydrolase family protein [Nesterenkonia sp.]
MTGPHMVDAPSDDADVPRYLEELGIPALADVHTHFMPQQVLDKVWAYFDRAEEHYGIAWPVTYRTSEAERLQTLRDLGAAAAVPLNYPHRPGMASWLNAWTREFAAAHDDVVLTGTFHPEPQAVDDVAEQIAAGARLFKAHVQIGGWSPTDELLAPVWAQLAEAGIPTVLHAGSAPLRGRHTGVGPVQEVLERHPRLPLIIAHMGMPEYHAFADLAERYEHVYLDTTMVFTDFTETFAPIPEGYRQRLPGLGRKVLLGSDFPNIPYPYAEQLRALHRLRLGDGWMRRVLWHNGAELLGLDGPISPAAGGCSTRS